MECLDYQERKVTVGLEAHRDLKETQERREYLVNRDLRAPLDLPASQVSLVELVREDPLVPLVPQELRVMMGHPAQPEVRVGTQSIIVVLYFSPQRSMRE